MSYLEESSHFNNWIFTKDELDRCARLRRAKCRKTLRLEREQKTQQEAVAPRKARAFAALLPRSSTAIEDTNDWHDVVNLDIDQEEASEDSFEAETPMDPPLLSALEETVLQSHYEKMIQDSCTQLFRTSDKVKGCAVMLFKRFYLSNSVMEFHPKYIVPTAIYVAGKVEEQYLSVDTVADKLSIDHKHIIAHEMVLLDGVRFQLIMYHPFRALLGFLDEFRAFSKSKKSKEYSLDVLQKLHADSTIIINELLLTNWPLRMYPSHLALAALYRTSEKVGDPELRQEDVVEYIRASKFLPSDENKRQEAVDKILGDIRAIDKVNDDEEKPSASKVYKKLKQFHPEEKSSKKEKKKKEKKKRKGEKDKEDKDKKKQKKE